MEELGHEEVVDLVGDGGVGVIREIRTGLVGGGGGGRGLPSGNVDGVKVLCHLSDHDWVETSVGCGSGSLLLCRLLAIVHDTHISLFRLP